MAYIGNQPADKYSTLSKQTITGDGTTGPYTLDYPAATAQDIEVFVNNVRQEPGVAYTVSGTALTMTGNVASDDDFYVVFQGRAVQTTTHPAGQTLQALNAQLTGDLKLETSSGGIYTVTGTNTSTDRTLTLPDEAGTVVTSAGADFTGDVTTTGNVGIGTSSPSVAIHIADTEAETGIQLGTGADLTIKRDVSESAGIINAGSDLNNLRFSTGGTERMRINSAGDVEIYDAVGQSDGAALHIRKNSDAEYLLHLQSNTGSSANQRGLKITSDTPNLSSPLILVENSGGEIFKVQNDGTMSKSSGSFKINHPLESKRDTHFLVHSFVEAPQADNIYRGKVDLVAGSATVNIDTVAGMTEGTFAALNREVQCFTSNESGWTAVKGSVSGNILTIEAQDNTCTDTISWLVVGERQDEHIRITSMTDDNGRVIVEPLKETEDPVEAN